MASMRASCSAQICLLHVPRAILDVPLGGETASGISSARASCAQICRLRISRAIRDGPRAGATATGVSSAHVLRAAQTCLLPRLPGQPRRALSALARPSRAARGAPSSANAAGSGARARGDPMEAKWLRARRQYSTSAVICSSPWPARYFIRARQRSPLASSQAREIGDAEAYVRLGLEQCLDGAPMAQQVRRLGADLHEPDLADVADRPGIVGALNLSHGIGHVRRQPSAFRLAADQGQAGARRPLVWPRGMPINPSMAGGGVGSGKVGGAGGLARAGGISTARTHRAATTPVVHHLLIRVRLCPRGKACREMAGAFHEHDGNEQRKGLEDGGSPSPSAWPYVQAEDALANTA